MNEHRLENTEMLFQSLVAAHPEIEKDLRRLISRVLMDTRNGFSRMCADIEESIPLLRVRDELPEGE